MVKLVIGWYIWWVGDWLGVVCAEIWCGGGGLDVKDQQLIAGLKTVAGVWDCTVVQLVYGVGAELL